jgi:hypothetical protein
MRRLNLLLTALFLSLAFVVPAQNLLDELVEEAKEAEKPTPVLQTFKGTRLIHGQTTEMPAGGDLQFIIQHRFGRVNTGFYEMFGWDQASIRIGLDYTLPFADFLCLGLGRSSYGKTWDGYAKFKLLQQKAKGSPLSLVYMSSMAINGLKPPSGQEELPFRSRISYVHQVILARKFSSRLSFQLSPSVVHRNLVPLATDANTFFVLGSGGHVRISKRVAITAEYFWLLPGQAIPGIYSQQPTGALSLGVDIETGGHVFQFHITNSQAMFDAGFLGETTGRVNKGDIHVGFNISRNFSFRKRHPNEAKLIKFKKYRSPHFPIV